MNTHIHTKYDQINTRDGKRVQNLLIGLVPWKLTAMHQITKQTDNDENMMTTRLAHDM